MYNIGTLIYNKLKGIVKTYPLVAENTTSFPFAIYKSTAIRPIENKDMIYEWTYDIQVDIVDDHYDKVVELCDRAVDRLLELNEEFDINIESVREDYVDDAYIREINITIKI